MMVGKKTARSAVHDSSGSIAAPPPNGRTLQNPPLLRVKWKHVQLKEGFSRRDMVTLITLMMGDLDDFDSSMIIYH